MIMHVKMVKQKIPLWHATATGRQLGYDPKPALGDLNYKNTEARTA